jgi:hypothetical protein
MSSGANETGLARGGGKARLEEVGSLLHEKLQPCLSGGLEQRRPFGAWDDHQLERCRDGLQAPATRHQETRSELTQSVPPVDQVRAGGIER